MPALKHTSLAAVLALVAGSTANAQWTVVNLHPSGASSSEAKAIYGSQQVGISTPSTGPSHAILWSGSAPSNIALDPTVDGGGTAYGVYAGTQAGETTINPGTTSSQTHASLWNSSAATWTDLHPTPVVPGVVHSGIYAITDGAQGGYFFTGSGGATFGASSPCLWHGTAASFVDLTPVGFTTGAVLGVAGNQQVGATYDTGLGWACVWNGTAASFVNLNPDPMLFSTATCTDGANQYGTGAIIGEDFAGLYPVQWAGTPESMTNLGLDDLYTRWGEVHATHGGWQVGYTTDTGGVDNPRACYWTGAPGTFTDLNQYLSAPYNGSNALGIWRHTASGTTYIVGYAENSVTTRREAVMWVNGPGVNLITSVAAPANCAASVGGTLPYTVRILNAGASPSGSVTLTVDLPSAAIATYASAVPAPSSVSASQLTFTLPSLTATGGVTDITINLNAAGAGSVATLAANATTAGEVDPTNNAASASSRIEAAPAATAAARGILSTNTAFANSLTPTGARYTVLNHPSSSPSGNWTVIHTNSNQPAAQNTLLLRIPTGGTPSIIAKTGTTVLAHGTVEAISMGAEVNDSGLVAFSGNDTGATATDSFVATSDGASVVIAAREGDPIPAMPGINYSDVQNWPNIFSNGQVAIAASSSPANNNAYLTDNGATVIARQNVTQPAAAPASISRLLLNSTGVWGLALDASGTQSIYQADLNTGSVDNDQAIVVNNTLVMQEGVTVLPGCTSPVGPGDIGPGNKFIAMGPAGHWFVRGSSINAHEDWIAQGIDTSITHAFMNGDPIHTGAVETFFESPALATAFFAMSADAGGHFVIGAMTNSADPFTDSVLVFDNQSVVARENDPIDLDNNGIFDDGLFIRSFDTDSVTLTPTGVLAVVTLRDADAALCHTNNTSRGQALIFIPVSHCGTSDYNGDGDFGTDADIQAFFACMAGNCCPTCFPGGSDFNADGDFGTDADIESFFRVLAGGNC